MKTKMKKLFTVMMTVLMRSPVQLLRHQFQFAHLAGVCRFIPQIQNLKYLNKTKDKKWQQI